MERYEKPEMELEEMEDEVYTDTARGPYLTTGTSGGNMTPIGTGP